MTAVLYLRTCSECGNARAKVRCDNPKCAEPVCFECSVTHDDKTECKTCWHGFVA